MNMTLDIDLSPNDIVTRVRPPTGPKRHIFSRMEGNDLLLRIDNSSLERFTACPRSAEFSLIRSRERAPGGALNFGGAIHKALEELYRHGFGDENFALIQEAFVNHFVTSPQPNGEWRSVDYGLTVLQQYRKKYMSDLDIYHPASVEQAFSLPLCTIPVEQVWPYTCEELLGEAGNNDLVRVNNVHVYWSGKIDLIMQTKDSPLQVWDHKTTSMMGPTFFGDFFLSQQTMGYVWAAKQILETSNQINFLVNCLALRKPTKTGTAIEFERQLYSYAPEHIEEWTQDVQYLVCDFLTHIAQSYFPKATKWCFGKFGQCPYHDVCNLAAVPSREVMLASDTYSDVTWTPFAV